jgi:hypothetical protein
MTSPSEVQETMTDLFPIDDELAQIRHTLGEHGLVAVPAITLTECIAVLTTLAYDADDDTEAAATRTLIRHLERAIHHE